MIKEIKHRRILKVQSHKSRENAVFCRSVTKFTCKIKELSLTPFLAFWVFTITPENAYAFQTHGQYEGLYVHQIAHLLYASSVAALAYRLKKTGLIKKRPWRLISMGMLLLAVWNLWAFVGHIVEYLLPQKDFVQIPGTNTPGICLASWLDIAYYILKFDHLFSVPALFLIYLGLRGLKDTSPYLSQQKEGIR